MKCIWCGNTCKHTFDDDTGWIWICIFCDEVRDEYGMIKIWNDNKSKWMDLPVGCLYVKEVIK